jgi:Na+-driven multidrug efflux pump
LNLIVINALRATGDARFPVVAGVASMIFIMAGGAWLLGVYFGLGLIGVWIAYTLDEWARGLIMCWRWWGRGWLPAARNTHRRLIRQRTSTSVL